MCVILINLFIPEKQQLAITLQNELSTDFEEAVVKWVDCPDLTKAPFHLAAPGLCGDTVLLDIGGLSNLFPCPEKTKIYNFKNILQQINRTQRKNFIIGGGLCNETSDTHLGELIMNATFSPAFNEQIIVKNKSRVVFSKRDFVDVVNTYSQNTNPTCHIYGNFFVSRGLKEQVLMIHAKKRTGRDFIHALQYSITRFFSKPNLKLMGLGGVFRVENGLVLHHVIRERWRYPITTRKEIFDSVIKYYRVPTPVIGFATIVNDNTQFIRKESKEISLTPWHAHSYSDYGGGYYHGAKLDDTTEYLGYFSVATKLYRIDPVPVFEEMANFCYL